MKLYELDEKFIQLMELIDDEENSATREMLADTMESITASQEEKYEAIVRIIRNKEADAEAFKKEAAYFAKRKQIEENSIKQLKNYLKNSLIVTKQDAVPAGVFRVRIQNAKGTVEVLDDSLLPEEYKVPQPDTVDKTKLYNAMKDGEKIPGAMLKANKSLIIQ